MPRVENKTGDLLLSLDNYNIRRALRTLECCLSQGSWFQTTEIKRSSFEIDGRTISVKISRPIVLRAIGYGPRNIYYETENIPPIVNVMKNGYDPTTDLLGLLMVKWFYKHIDTQDAFKISNQQRIGDFINDVRTIFPLIFPETKDFIADVISHFIAARILGKDTRDVSWDEETMLTLMPKGIALWEELADNSVLLELFRDDIWLEKDRHDVSPTRALPREKRFMECIGICQSIALMEQHFHRSLFNISIKRRYINSFGDNTIAYHLSRGILGSIRREIDPHRPALIDNAYKTLSALISNTEEDLHRVHS
ncbi:MAG: hypothetical protein HY761_09620 [Candidatus Omnitrophica bacterium]|nr:hypothetical protein [Candidatus Omnitrophota bacterium]